MDLSTPEQHKPLKDGSSDESFKKLGLQVDQRDGQPKKVTIVHHQDPDPSTDPMLEQNGHGHDPPTESGNYADSRSVYPKSSSRYAYSQTYDGDTISSTRSLYDNERVYEQIHDRRYSANYFMPNDEPEQTRMTIIHNVFYFLLNKRLTTVPLNNPTRVLDIGTGTGDWAINVAEDYPDCEVIGTDIAAIQPSGVPHNVFFEIFDAEDETGWTYVPNSIDLIHFRNMKGTFERWDEIYRRAIEVTKPGGYIELVEFGQQLGFESYFKQDSAIHAWFEALRETAKNRKGGYSFTFLNREVLAAAGYVDIEETEMRIPLGDWAEDENMRRTSRLWLVSCLEGLEALSLRTLTELKGWTVDEVRKVCRSIGRELLGIAKDKERAKGFGIIVNIVSGRKPSGDEELGARDALALPANNERREAQAVAVEGVAADHMSMYEQQI